MFLRILRLVLCVVVMSAAVSAQSDSGQARSACDTPEASQFDFWLGEWNCHSSYNDSNGVEHRYTVHNTITKVLGGCVIEENFDGASIGLIGRSLSVFDTEMNKWRQTWVDNNGSYMEFVGEFANGVMTLERTVSDGNSIYIQRMRFTEITDSSFIWFWERSSDDGERWKILWRLDYERVKND